MPGQNHNSLFHRVLINTMTAIHPDQPPAIVFDHLQEVTTFQITSQIRLHHLLPPWPVVSRIVAPHVQAHGNALRPHQCGGGVGCVGLALGVGDVVAAGSRGPIGFA